MNYSANFKNRMGIRGSSAYDRALFAQQRGFDLYFKDALNRELVAIDGIEQYATFQDQNQNNNKDLSDDKYMVVEKDSNMHVGSYVVWRKEPWLVFSQEHKSVLTHKQAKIRASNHVIKWMIGSQICGSGQGYPAYVQNNTLYTLGVSTSGNNAWIVNAKYGMYMQDNPDTRSIKIGQRVFIGGSVFQVLFHDYVARKGLISFLLEEDFVNVNKDNIELEVADYYTAIDQASKEPVLSGISKEVTIIGLDNVKIGTLVKYEAKVFQDGLEIQPDITDWTIDDTDYAVTIVEQDSSFITIRIENNFKKVGSIVSIIGKTSDGVFGSHTVKIISPY
jgi:hypothetical protein